MVDKVKKLFEEVPFEKWHHPSEENCEERICVIKKLAELLRPHLQTIHDEEIRNASRNEYCKKSSFYPRGYYYPDPLADIIVSNAPRGSIKKTDPGDAEFVYFFDDNDELSFVVVKEELEGLKDIRWRCEKLFSFGNMRVGFTFLLEQLNDPDGFTSDILIETRSTDRAEYTISYYGVYRSWGMPYQADCSEAKLLEFSNGLPVKWSEKLFIDSADLWDFGMDESEKLDGSIPFGPETSPLVFELEYDEKGFPSSMKASGEPCKIGRIKRPIMSGMMK
ncbi:MAG: hypothetical protein J5772_05690 [Clostridia bacterium]|nr:hypothetical protein [Clostridia bacterium]